MADIAWIAVHKYNRRVDSVELIGIQEASIATIERWEQREGDPRVAAGVKTLLTLQNGSQVFVTETVNELAELVVIKRL